jgi:hypothetical protein
MTLIFDLRGSRRDLACKATNVVAKVLLIIDGEYGFSKTPRVISGLAVLQRANIQSIAQEELLVE